MRRAGDAQPAGGTVRGIVEKPAVPTSHYAVSGPYFLEDTAPEKAKRITPSARGELEIVSVLETYREEDTLSDEEIGRGNASLDTATHAGRFVRTLQDRPVSCPDETCLRGDGLTREK